MPIVFGASRVLPASAAILGLALLAACNAPEPAAAPEAVPSEAMPETAEPAPETMPEAPIKSAAPTAPAARPAFVGTWGVDLAQCAVEQEYEQPPMILRADGYDQHEAHCEFDSVTETGPSQWRVSGQCSVEGDEQAIDYNLAVIDGNLVHWADGGRKDAWTLIRCPE